MPRKRRVVLPGYPHHILHRGHNRQAVFKEEEDYLKYLADVKELKQSFGVDVYAWCLLPDEVHLLINPGPDTDALGAFMKSLAARMTRHRNRREERRGTLWESRYRSSPVQFSWLLPCVRYLEQLPVRQGRVSGPEWYPWSSYTERMTVGADTMLDPDPDYLNLADTERDRCALYGEYVRHTPEEKETALIHNAVERNQLTGDPDFTDEVEALTGRRVTNRGRGRPRLKPR
ncbi:MAG TPA: transposase [Marinobacter hydrocarbonoclasticus]|nr:transposase [Alcanivorax sp.]MBI53178.1 transposase [Alcanivorax sp.]MBM1145805.1 transposase [Alcanivorax sp. ZXX171]HAX08732.1 transposase [Marinobacter nauticus]|tara:strand:+ start:442 stop:1134 length:693 start_codon:yes stop_codon:yes gene_type:complete